MDLSRLDLNALRSFLAVVEHGGFREAAARLGQPRSTVSRRIAELEAALGQQLFRRTTRTVSLTDVGAEFAREVAPALQSVDRAVKTVQQATATPSGVLRVTAPQTFAENFLGDFLVRFSAEYPEVRVTLNLTDRYVDLLGEGFDVALRAGPLPDSTLRARLLTTSPIRCFASPEYLARKGTPKRPEDLAHHDVLGFGTDETTVKWPFAGRRRTTLLSLTPRLTANSFLLLRKLAAQGLGIARMPEGLIDPTARSGDLVEVLADFATPPSPLHAVFPPGEHLSPRVRVFLDALTQSLVLPGAARTKARSAK